MLDVHPLPALLEAYETDTLVFGRGEVHFRTDHPSCSRRHATLTREKKQQHSVSGEEFCFVLRDLGSVHGTLLNGGRLAAEKANELEDGDELQFGFSSRLYVYKEGTCTLGESPTTGATSVGSNPSATPFLPAGLPAAFSSPRCSADWRRPAVAGATSLSSQVVTTAGVGGEKTTEEEPLRSPCSKRPRTDGDWTVTRPPVMTGRMRLYHILLCFSHAETAESNGRTSHGGKGLYDPPLDFVKIPSAHGLDASVSGGGTDGSMVTPGEGEALAAPLVTQLDPRRSRAVTRSRGEALRNLQSVREILTALLSDDWKSCASEVVKQFAEYAEELSDCPSGGTGGRLGAWNWKAFAEEEKQKEKSNNYFDSDQRGAAASARELTAGEGKARTQSPEARSPRKSTSDLPRTVGRLTWDVQPMRFRREFSAPSTDAAGALRQEEHPVDIRQFGPSFIEAAAGLKAGTISPIVSSERGMHLILRVQ
eukprot:GHVT01071715.1.p1 GENE.GHVT01071715.1~~GHVT01071715.1.p1  ORF type:complete len:480 (-),score=80.93 GHVT01071715.1:271-1710(-)